MKELEKIVITKNCSKEENGFIECLEVSKKYIEYSFKPIKRDNLEKTYHYKKKIEDKEDSFVNSLVYSATHQMINHDIPIDDNMPNGLIEFYFKDETIEKIGFERVIMDYEFKFALNKIAKDFEKTPTFLEKEIA